MPIMHEPYYWVACDGCDARVPPADAGVTAWSDRHGAAACAYDSGWFARNGVWLCYECKQGTEEGDDDG